MKRLQLAGLLVATAAMAASVTFAPTASADLAGHWIQNEGSRLCLQPEGNSTAHAALIVQMPCDRNNPQQRWVVDFVRQPTTTDVGIWHERNVGTGFCLDVANGAKNHSPIQQWTCNSNSDENWDNGQSSVTLRSRVSGTSSYCLDVPEASVEAGVAMQLYKCNNTSAQVWNRTGPDGPIIT